MIPRSSPSPGLRQLDDFDGIPCPPKHTLKPPPKSLSGVVAIPKTRARVANAKIGKARVPKYVSEPEAIAFSDIVPECIPEPTESGPIANPDAFDDVGHALRSSPIVDLAAHPAEPERGDLRRHGSSEKISNANKKKIAKSECAVESRRGNVGTEANTSQTGQVQPSAVIHPVDDRVDNFPPFGATPPMRALNHDLHADSDVSVIGPIGPSQTIQSPAPTRLEVGRTANTKVAPTHASLRKTQTGQLSEERVGEVLQFDKQFLGERVVSVTTPPPKAATTAPLHYIDMTAQSRPSPSFVKPREHMPMRKEADRFGVPTLLGKSSENAPLQEVSCDPGPAAYMDDVMMVISEIHEALVQKISGRFEGLRHDVRVNRDRILRDAATSLHEMRYECASHFNRLIDLETNYANCARDIGNGWDHLGQGVRDLGSALQQALRKHDQQSLAKNMPTSLFTSSVPSSLRV